MITASRVAPRLHAGIIEAVRRHRLMVSAVTVLYLLVYLWSIGDIVGTATDQNRFGAVPSIQIAADWPAKLLRQTAPFTYEPVLAAHLTGHIQLFLAPVNVALGLLLGGLTLTLLLGAQVAAALTGLRNWLFPLALAILLAGLAWSAKRLAGLGPPTDPGLRVTGPGPA